MSEQGTDWRELGQLLWAYEERGVKCFPVGEDKRPFAESWKPYLDETPEERIERFKQVSESGTPFLIAGVAGSNVVLDVDDQAAFSEAVNEEDIAFEGPTVLTPAGGLHYWCRGGEDVHFRSFSWGELRTGDRHYVILPGSGWQADYEKAGRTVQAPYSWAPDRTPLHQWEGALPALPAVVSQLIRRERPDRDDGATSRQVGSGMLRGIQHGSRNDGLFRYACSLQARGLSADEARLLVETAAANCAPPYPSDAGEERVEAMVKRMYETYAEPGTGEGEGASSVGGPEVGRRLAQEIQSDPQAVWERVREVADLSPAAFGAFKDELRGANGRYPFNMGQLEKALQDLKHDTRHSGPASAADVADQLIDCHYRDGDGKLILHFWHTSFWLWEGTHYRELTNDEIRAGVNAYIQGRSDVRDRAGSRYLDNVVENLRTVTFVPETEKQPCWFGDRQGTDATQFIAFENGILNVQDLLEHGTAELVPHTPEFFSGNRLPYDYDPGAECPAWNRFLSEVLPDPEVRQLLQQFTGYCVVADTSLQVFLILVGEGANGKSVILLTVRALLGEENVSAVPLELFEEKHYLVQTRGKLLNIVPEVSDLDRTCEGILKGFVAGDPVAFNEKYKPVVTERPTARVIIATNELPRFRDRSLGLWRRMVLLPFDVVIPEEKQDPDLANKLAGELPGIFNWAVEGLRQLRENGRFIGPERCRLELSRYQSEGNPARAFLEEDYECDVTRQVPTQAIYDEYRRWCENRGYRPLGEANFGREVQRVFPQVRKTRPRDPNGRRVAHYAGIRGPRSVAILSRQAVIEVLRSQTGQEEGREEER